MLVFAREVEQAVRGIQGFDEFAVKVASADLSLEAQGTKAAASHQLYEVMEKKASESFPTLSATDSLVALVEKVAHCLGKPAFTNEDRWKLAAAVVADTAITSVLSSTTSEEERTKLAEQRAYGREFFVELIGKAL